MKVIIHFCIRFFKGVFIASLLLVIFLSSLAFILFVSLVVDDFQEKGILFSANLLYSFFLLISVVVASWLLWAIVKKSFPIDRNRPAKVSVPNENHENSREQQLETGKLKESIEVEIDKTPEFPVAFAYKMYWFTVKSNDAKSVVDALELTNVEPANWGAGMQVSCGKDVPSRYEDYAFVTPPVKGWVFVLSRHFGMSYHSQPELKLPPEDGFDLMFHKLYTQFPDVQFHGSYRVVGAVAWARALNGKVVRMFAEAEGILANIGPLTKEEHKLNILDIGGLPIEEADEKIADYIEQGYELEEQLTSSGVPLSEAEEQVKKQYPFITPDANEELPLQLAEMWSINPSQLEEMDLPKSVGFIGKLPKSLIES